MRIPAGTASVTTPTSAAPAPRPPPRLQIQPLNTQTGLARSAQSGQSARMAHGGDPLSFEYEVNDVRDLIAVITSLRSHLAARPEEWENTTLDSFLYAIASWLSAFPQSYINNDQDVPTPDWRFVADVLRVGRIYE
jgi:hypothetical protein